MAFILSLALDGGPDDAGLTDRNQSPFETGTDSKDDPMASAGPTSNSFISQRLKLHYVDWGNRGAPPLLLVHGGRDHCRNWEDRKSTRLNPRHYCAHRMPPAA